jgi:hypothetical protein
MSSRLFRAFVGGAAWAVSVSLLSIAAPIGCSSSSGGDAAIDASVAQCPASVAQAIGAACTREGEDCGIGYTCGNVPQQAHCLCTGGKYACTDSTGADVPKGSDPVCIATGPANDKECPAAETGTEGKACKTAGLLCSYIGLQCPENGEPNLDTCQCESAANTTGLFFHCEPKLCIPRSDASDDAFAAPDASTTDAPADG